MKKLKRKFCLAALFFGAVTIMLGLVPLGAFAGDYTAIFSGKNLKHMTDDGLSFTGNTSGSGWSIPSEKTIKFTGKGNYYFNGGSNPSTKADTGIIIIESGADITITLSNVNIAVGARSPVILESGAKVTMRVSGTNTLTGSTCGIDVPQGAKLTITDVAGDGESQNSLECGEYAGSGGAGIGGKSGEANGEIEINGGKVTAYGNGGGAGIGSGKERKNASGKIRITGGVVTATGSTNTSNAGISGAGIGSSSILTGLENYDDLCRDVDIEITGGKIIAASAQNTANAGGGAAGIGAAVGYKSIVIKKSGGYETWKEVEENNQNVTYVYDGEGNVMIKATSTGGGQAIGHGVGGASYTGTRAILQVADGTIKGLVSPVSYQKPDNEIDTTDFSCNTVEWYEGNGTEGKKLSGDDKFGVETVYTAVINLQPANNYLTLDGIPGGEKFFAIEDAPDGTTVTNDDGDGTGIEVIAVFPETETAEAPTDKVLQSVTTPAAITGVANGTAKNAAALGLPTTVNLVTDQGTVTANVTWDVESSSYDPATKTEQTFMVNGTFALPAGVENNSAQPVSLTVSVSVTVSAATTTSPYAISLDVTDPYVFPERTVGYTDSPVKSVTVKNIGTADTGALDVVISGVNSKDFTLSKASIQSLTAGNTDSFTLSPDMGLTAGTYNATVAVSGDNGLRASFSATFKVNAATAVSPYAISLDVSGTSYTFPDRTVGYTEPPTKSVTVKNTGTEATGALSVLISGPNSADFTLSKTSIASIAAEKTDAFSINPKTGLSSKAYKATVTVSGDNSLAKSFDVSFTVTAATSGSNETEDEVEKESETDTAIPTNPATKPTTEGVDAGENVKYFKSIDDLPETMAGIVEVNTDGIVVAKPAEVLKGLNAEAKAAVGEKPDVIVPLPAFEADVEKSGNAAVVMFEMDMKDFDELDIDEAVVLKLQSDGQTVLLKRSASAAKINAGQYAWTDAFDDPVPGAHVIDAKGYYHLYVAIKDDGDMDYEKDTPGTVIDPLALAKKQGGGTSLESSGGSGCEAGASGIFAPFALAALALAVKRRGKK